MESKESLELEMLALDVANRKQQNESEAIYCKQEMLRRNLEVLISLRKIYTNFESKTVIEVDDKISQLVANLSI